ncbi:MULTISPECIES: hypothetical protein [Pseudoalteromonas]|jgi:hypothetical protein|uniref:Uncharacterized protein n=2 Tax=Pseudoalteromonas TaxID=53246 RepID=A0ACC6R043_9GAMM|nr:MULTISPECIES: hypothetical protein [unclassified Pseudoalteromonas]KPZ51604.1 hypothetical protein AN393_03865 [Pseudoalteromonas sp. P1-25]MCW1717770.1 hypothetical protein [Pseudoalteromonas sp. A3]MDC9520913.1 hypothetical protein [Pseudoalteromonas sp. Angola-31]GEK78501.1 hypothetical protein PAT01_38050 [Pseudoalteromonas atlantica]|tara:strand:- start:103 stop:567 length:465 start_codon:yes stop_codon:yes gene_type:complete
MKKLTRYKKTPSAKLLWTLGFNTFIAVIVLFWVEVFIEQPLLHQFLYLFAFVLLRFFSQWYCANTEQAHAIEIVNGEFELLGINIKVSELEEVLYCQTKRFEHILRFKFKNATYQDIEITAPDLIDDLRFYYFMVDNGLPVKMTDDSGRFFDED